MERDARSFWIAVIVVGIGTTAFLGTTAWERYSTGASREAWAAGGIMFVFLFAFGLFVARVRPRS